MQRMQVQNASKANIESQQKMQVTNASKPNRKSMQQELQGLQV